MRQAKLVEELNKFIESGFNPSQFTKALYDVLSLHFDFIAHYNREGFYQARFKDPKGRLETLALMQSLRPDFCVNATVIPLRRAFKLAFMAQAKFIQDSALNDRIEHLESVISASSIELERIKGMR